MQTYIVSKRVTPVIQAAAYGAGDQLGPASTKLADVVSAPQGVTRLVGIKVIDKAKQKSGIDILFFNSLPTNATADNAALDIADAEMAAKYVGVAAVATGDYKDLANSSIACVSPIQPIPMRAAQNTASPDGRSLWFTLCNRGTPTYTSTSDLILVLEFE